MFKYKKCLDDYPIQIDFLEDVFKEIQKSKKGGLIVIDNIYSLISSSFTHFKIYDSFERTRKQAEIINRLRWLAKMSNAAVLILNKVSDVL
jgi:adenylate kinase family enzyme